MKHIAKVRLPECWKRLVGMEFPDDLEGILSEKTDHEGVADPKPHYDDARQVAGRFADGAEFSLELCSGQSNYYGGLSIWKGDEPIYEDFDPLESFEGLLAEGDGGDTYEIEVEWVPDAEWAESVGA